MDMGDLNNILLEILATGVRFYAIKCFIDIFLSKDEYQCKYTWVLYVIACLWTSIIYEIFKMPVLNIISNLTALSVQGENVKKIAHYGHDICGKCIS